MDYKNIPDNAFVIKYKNVIKYIPEINVKIHPYDNSLWKIKFPCYYDVDITKLQLTNIGVYSISTPDNSRKLIELLVMLNKQYKFAEDISDLVVTDANGGIGGYAIRLGMWFKKINITEINHLHANIIINNLSTYHIDLANIKVYNIDYLDVMYKLQQDIIIFDLPWFGRGYKYIKNLRLGLNNVNIWYIINELYKRNSFKICVFMAPINYDINNFIVNIQSPNILIKKTDKHYFIVVLNIK